MLNVDKCFFSSDFPGTCSNAATSQHVDWSIASKIGKIRNFLDRSCLNELETLGESPRPRHPVIPAEVWCLGYVFRVQIPNPRRGKISQ